MSQSLLIRSRQRARAVDGRHLRRICLELLREELGRTEFELGVFLVAEPAMARLNLRHLAHEGSTDVITFDYGDGGQTEPLAGEIFVCVPVAVKQARQFRTTWQEEVVRYIVHGILHLLGHDDHSPIARRRMKREENRLVQRLAARHRLNQLGSVN